MITICNDKIGKLPLSRSILSAIFEIGAEDIKSDARLLQITEADVKDQLERQLLVNGMTIEIGVCAMNFIPDVVDEYRKKNRDITVNHILFEAIDMASIYVVNCKPMMI